MKKFVDFNRSDRTRATFFFVINNQCVLWKIVKNYAFYIVILSELNVIIILLLLLFTKVFASSNGKRWWWCAFIVGYRQACANDKAEWVTITCLA